jgi:acid phosphatase family membrane protein YuiD
MAELLSNKLILLPTYSWFISQFLKVLWTLLSERRLRPSVFIRAGGMPSAHSAVVTSLATAVGRQQGAESALFAVCFFFAAIVMYDAAGVRRAVGMQAAILNRMLDEYFERQEFSERRLRELIGHTPIQVLAGAALGFTVAWFGI